MAGEEKRTRVLYEAIADFSRLTRAAAKARAELAGLRGDEAKLNKDSVKGSNDVEKARARETKTTRELSTALSEVTSNTRTATDATRAHARVTDDSAVAHRNTRTEVDKHGKALSTLSGFTDRAAKATDRLIGAHGRHSASTRRSRQDNDGLNKSFSALLPRLSKVNDQFIKFGAWRPHLMPPFIGLVPVISAVLAVINPLVSGLGAVGGAALGLASNIGSLGGAAFAAVPGLAALLSIALALKVALGGIGGVFKKYTASKTAGGGGGGGGTSNKAELTQAEELERAWEKYRRAIENVKWAQEDLDNERKDYIKRLKELQKAVDRAALSEARAAANAQLAREDYANILADPGSTKGEKMLSAVGVDEAKADLQDVRDENKQNAADLADMQAKGMEGDRQVIQAKRALTDAIWAERDAYLDLTNVQNGSNKASSGGGAAADAFKQALDKLSPSARAVVLALIAMDAAWQSMRRTVQEAFFAPLVDDVENLRKLFPAITEMLSDTAGALGRVTEKILQLMVSQEWLDDFRRLGKQNIPIIENLGDALISVLNILRDLTFAAGPFLISLTEGLASGAASMEALVSTARDTGQLAGWLEVVRNRLDQWWRIIKNIGMTLFNFGAAAGNFGQWITDSFEKITESWLTASQTAREAGSPFQEFLENIKPLLTEVGGLIGDFFKWFADTSSDTGNISGFTRIIQLLRDELGPAISGILQTLSDSGMGESLVSALAQILEALNAFLKNGGAEGMGAFWETTSKLFGLLASITEMVPAPIISALVTAMGTLAALNFFGIDRLIGLLLKLAGASSLRGILSSLGSVFPSLARAGSGAVPPYSTAAVGRGAYSTATGVASPLSTAAVGQGAYTASAASGAATTGAGVTSAVARFGSRLRGGLAVAIPLEVASLAVDNFVTDDNGGARETYGNIGSQALQGAAIGATLGSVVPGVGTAVGGLAGGLIGGASAAVNTSAEDWDKTGAEIASVLPDWMDFGGWWQNTGQPGWDSMISWFGDAADNIGTTWNNVTGWFSDVADNIGKTWDNVTGWFSDVADNISGLWNDNVVATWDAFISMLGRLWEQYVIAPFEAVSATIGDLWNGVVYSWQALISIISTAWNDYVVVPFSTLATTISAAWNDYVVVPFSIAATAISTWWNENVVPVWNSVASTISNWWSGTVVPLWNSIAYGIGSWWSNSVVPIWNSVASAIRQAWNGVTSFFNGIATNIGNWWQTSVVNRWTYAADAISNWWNTSVVSRWNTVANTIERVWNSLVAFIKDKISAVTNINLNPFDAARNIFNSIGQHEGGVIHRSEGGGVPGQGDRDTKPAMLTPGEFVIRKAIVERVGADTLQRFNSGVISFGNMLRSASVNSQQASASPVFFETGGLVPSSMNVLNSGSNSSTSTSSSGSVFTVENLTINNPSPEPYSDSMPRALRKLAYLGG